MAQSPRQQYQERKDSERIDELLTEAQDRDDLSDWEIDFLDSMISKIDKMPLPELSESQYKKLTEITERKDEYQVW